MMTIADVFKDPLGFLMAGVVVYGSLWIFFKVADAIIAYVNKKRD